MTKNEERGHFTISDLKPVLPENTYECKGCPFTEDPRTCIQMMYHSETYCKDRMVKKTK